MKIGYRLAAALFCCLLLLLAGCSKAAEPTEVPTTDAPTEQEETTGAVDTSLNSLRQAMAGTPQLFAVAYFGYQDNIDSDVPVDPFEAMQAEAPQLCEDLPFLLDIPQEQIIGECGELYCIVPLDENATVAVSRGAWDENNEGYTYEESVYFSESGEPVLLLCNNEGWEPDTQVSISSPSGEIIWYPQLDDNQCAMPLCDDERNCLFYDFSAYREMLIKEYREMEGEWVKPTEEFLIGTTWMWECWTKDGREVKYQVAFDTETLSVRWDDGIDEEIHEYTGAPWSLTEESGYALLSVDFREMAGVLRYNLMYHEVYEQLYFGMDVLQAEMPVGWEPLYRFMMPSSAQDPIDMAGVWELAWTEFEGCQEEVEPGSNIIEITVDEAGSLWISFADYGNPDEYYADKELVVFPYEMYDGCGNDRWTATVNHTGKFGTEYRITLLDDGMLLLQRYWELDGAPTVSYGWYYRV